MNRNRGVFWIVLAGLMIILSACSEKEGHVKGLSFSQKKWGETAEGQSVMLFTLANDKGLEIQLTNYGGYMTALKMPDRKGRKTDVVLGYKSLDEYLQETQYMGCLIGRFGNRIDEGSFTLEGKTYSLARNNGENHLHGGIRAFHKVVWEAETLRTEEAVGVRLSYLSPDGEEGYPGNLKVRVNFLLNRENELRLEYLAETDRSTPVNLTHHAYFNLTGVERDILSHEMTIAADAYLPVDRGLIPLGEIRTVEGTPFDFRDPVAIGARISDDDIQLVYGMGYDHNWVLNHPADSLGLAARVYEPESGRQLEIYTTEPGLQFYSGNFLDGSTLGKGNKIYKHRYAFVLEPQHFPDSPNRPEFPTTILKPGQVYRQVSVYRFTSR